MNDEAGNMNQEFPKMPDAMRKMIEQEVEQQLQKKTGKFIGRRVMIAVLAATLALGTTAFAGVLYRMKSKQVGTYAVKTTQEKKQEQKMKLCSRQEKTIM